MASKRQRKRTARRRNPRNAARPLKSDEIADLPRPLRLAVEFQQRFAELVAGSEDEAEVRRNLDDRLGEAVERIVELGEAFDVFDIVECLKLSETLSDPETYRETEHEGLATVFELAAAILSCRGTRHPESADRGKSRRPHEVIDEIRALCLEITDIGSMRLALDAITAPGDRAQLSLSASLREVFVRNTTYEHMLLDTLDGLFGEPTVQTACRRVIGCTGAEAVAVVSALQEMHAAVWQERFESMAEFMNFVAEAHATWSDEAEAAIARGEPLPEVSDEDREAASRMHRDAWGNPADAAVVNVDAVSERTGLAVDVVASVIRLLSNPMSSGSPIALEPELLVGRQRAVVQEPRRDCPRRFGVPDHRRRVRRTRPSLEGYPRRVGGGHQGDGRSVNELLSDFQIEVAQLSSRFQRPRRSWCGARSDGLAGRPTRDLDSSPENDLARAHRCRCPCNEGA